MVKLVIGKEESKERKRRVLDSSFRGKKVKGERKYVLIMRGGLSPFIMHLGGCENASIAKSTSRQLPKSSL